MPVYMTPELGDCSSYNSLKCAKDYKHGALLEDDGDWVRPEIPPEETQEYLEATARAETYMKMMGDSLTVLDGLYWRRLAQDLTEFGATWGVWLRKKLLILGTELTGCIFIGAIFIGVLYTLLALLGPFRIKTLGTLIAVFVIGSIFAMESIQIAASAIIGMSLLIFIFLAKISTGNRVLKLKLRKKGQTPEDSIYIFIDFWYIGNRTIWINLSEKIIGTL